jgi:hypothetical protein
MNNDNGGGAFPAHYRFGGEAGGIKHADSGTSLRDWFAGMYLGGNFPLNPLDEEKEAAFNGNRAFHQAGAC